MNNKINKFLFALEKMHECIKGEKTMIERIIEIYGRNPYLILIACLISLRARDNITLPICIALFQTIQNPHDLLTYTPEEIEKILFRCGFYRAKTKAIFSVTHEIIQKHKGIVPSTFKELMMIKNVGHKTAALVLSQGYLIPKICVDTHVFRLCKQWNLVNAQTPEQCMGELESYVPKDTWNMINRAFVLYGQQCCRNDKRCGKCIFPLVCEAIENY